MATATVKQRAYAYNLARQIEREFGVDQESGLEHKFATVGASVTISKMKDLLDELRSVRSGKAA